MNRRAPQPGLDLAAELDLADEDLWLSAVLRRDTVSVGKNRVSS